MVPASGKRKSADIMLVTVFSFLFPVSGLALTGRTFYAWFSAFFLPAVFLFHVYFPYYGGFPFLISILLSVSVYSALAIYSVFVMRKVKYFFIPGVIKPSIAVLMLCSAAFYAVFSEYKVDYAGNDSAYPLIGRGDVFLLKKDVPALGDVIYHGGLKRVIAVKPCRVRFFCGRIYIYEEELELREYAWKNGREDVFAERNGDIDYPVYVSSADSLLRKRDEYFELEKGFFAAVEDNRSAAEPVRLPEGRYPVLKSVIFSADFEKMFKTVKAAKFFR